MENLLKNNSQNLTSFAGKKLKPNFGSVPGCFSFRFKTELGVVIREERAKALMNFFFPLGIVRGTYMNLYSFESSTK